MFSGPAFVADTAVCCFDTADAAHVEGHLPVFGLGAALVVPSLRSAGVPLLGLPPMRVAGRSTAATLSVVVVTVAAC